MKPRQSFPFNHLSLAEIDEYNQLLERASKVFMTHDERRRLADLGSRRFIPPSDCQQEGAA